MLKVTLPGRIENGVLSFDPVYFGEGLSCDVRVVVEDLPIMNNMEEITTVVSNVRGVPVEVLRSNTRGKVDVVLSRQFAMYFCFTKLRLSLNQIGLYFGGREHSTVRHSIHVVRDQLELEQKREDKPFTDIYREINLEIHNRGQGKCIKNMQSLGELVRMEMKKIIEIKNG